MLLVRFLPIGFFAACENTWPGSWIRHGQWAFAVTETLHIMTLGMLLGTIIVVDLRLLGLGSWRQSAAELASDLAPWTWTALGLMFVTGIPLFMSEALRLSRSGPFFVKMICLCGAIAIQFAILRGKIGSQQDKGEGLGKVMGAVSLMCWLGVALAGRAIAFPFLLHFSSNS